MALWCKTAFVWVGLIALFSCGSAESELNLTSEPPPSPVSTEIPLRDLAFATLAPPTIEIIQQTPTPLPTATATPTPTPIVYTIESGDTLLGIAIQQQTTVEEIQALNPDVRPELLSIGQEIVLPPPATPVFSGERATPLPIQIGVRSASLYPDGAGGLWVIGEVENTTDYFIENLRLELILYGEGGIEVGRKQAWTAASLLSPAGSAPFGVLFPQKPEGNLQVEVREISGFTAAALPDDGRYYFGLTADEPAFSAIGDTVTVSGTVTNGGEQTAVDVSVLVIAFDADGAIAGFSTLKLGQISAAADVPYTAVLIPPGGSPERVEIQIFSSGVEAP